jgi:hypothetical protein
VQHRNSVFHDVLKLVPWASFDKLVDEHGTDAASRRFTSRQHLTTLLFAQLSGAASLREIEAAMASHRGRLYHAGAVAPKRSTFADSNRSRDFRVFSGLFEVMLAGASRGFRRKMADAVRSTRPACVFRGSERNGRAFRLPSSGPRRMSSTTPTSAVRSITP